MPVKFSIALCCLALFCATIDFTCAVSAQQKATPAVSNPPQAEKEQLAPRRGTIKGRVVDDDGQPLADAPVSATPVGRTPTARRPGPAGGAGTTSQTTTDEQGNFALENLTPASYSISATIPGYITPPAEEQTGAGIYHLGDWANIMLVKGGVITGKVVNASGEPLTGLSVNAIRIGNIDGEEEENLAAQGITPGQGFGRNWRTDDRGVYRIYGLVPGTYIVQAGPPGGRGGGGPNIPSPFSEDAPTYYPSAVRDAAVRIALPLGAEVSDIDIRYRGEKGRAISGKVLARAGDDPNGFNATVISLSLPGSEDVIATTVQMNRGAGGNFALYGIPDGEYEISAQRNGALAESDAVAGPQHVSVRGQDVGGIQLVLAPLASLNGRVIMERKPGICPSPHKAFIEEVLLSTQREETAKHDAASVRRLRPSAPIGSGEFTLRNLDAGRWRIHTQLPDENWYLRAISAETRPATAGLRKSSNTAAAPASLNPARTGFTLKSGEKLTGVTVTITEGAASIKGKLASASANADSKILVYLIPAEKEAADDVLRYVETNATTEGGFHFKNLAPGRYYLLTKAVKNPAPGKPLAWDNAQRASLRKEAESAGNLVELQSCQRINDYRLNLR